MTTTKRRYPETNVAVHYCVERSTFDDRSKGHVRVGCGIVTTSVPALPDADDAGA
jgi:hypothetical protein